VTTGETSSATATATRKASEIETNVSARRTGRGPYEPGPPLSTLALTGGGAATINALA
jgi:hypothetical protein